MKTSHKCQIISSESDSELCRRCGNNLTDIAKIKYTGHSETTPTTLQEYFRCRTCGGIFAVRYEYFDSEGHINSMVFTDDSENPEFNFLEMLTDEQKRLIVKHFNGCPVCQARRDEKILVNAWFSDIIHSLREC